MILRKVTLNPFGGLVSTQVEFRPGLNVIIGHNEAGKSTLFSAIQKVLFTGTELNKKEYEKEIKNYIPIGGDTCHVELEFDAKGSTYTIKRLWGATKGSVLIVGSGAAVTDEAAIAEKLTALLPAKEGTFKSVLMTYQSGLSKTIEDLKIHYTETLHSLGDVLRRAILETDGVSVDLLREKIEKRYHESFSHWDPKLNLPEKNRGIGNKWAREVGRILDAYYSKEELRVKLINSRNYEKEIDSVNVRLNQIESQIKEKEHFISKYAPVVDSIHKRIVFEARFKAAELELDKYTSVNSSWPVLENETVKLKADLVPMEVHLKKLHEGKIEAENAEKNRNKLEQLDRARRKNTALENAKAELEKIKKLASDDLDIMRKCLARIENLKTRLLAGKLSLELSSESEMKITVRKDLDEPVKKIVKSEQPLGLKAEGRIRLEHDNWSMSVTSGEAAFEEAEKEFQEASIAMEELFKKFGVGSFADAEDLSALYQEKLGEAERAEINFNEEIEGTSLNELEKFSERVGVVNEPRPLHEIVGNIVNLENEISGIKKTLESTGRRIREYENEFGDKKKLLVKVARIDSEKDTIERELNALGELPEEIDDPEGFVAMYDKEKESVELLKADKNDCFYKLTELSKQVPDVTPEEIERQFKDAEERLIREMDQGTAITRIRTAALELLNRIDTDTFSGLEKDLEKYMGKITDDRYKKLSMDQSLPGGFVRKDGEVIPYPLMSYGTKDALGLSLRLVMGRLFLNDSKGFYVMDDPFVDMDPVRQKAGAEMLREFAENWQLIIFTCHPSHADLIGGNRIGIS
jgi:exonuclease SbcC